MQQTTEKAKVCQNCQCDLTLPTSKPVRGYCYKCYARLLGRGEITKKNGSPINDNCKDCGTRLFIGKRKLGRCLKCHEAMPQKPCRRCGAKLNALSSYGYCVDCRIHKVKQPTKEQVLTDKFYLRIKMLTIKFKWGMLRPDEVFEALSLWCDCCYHEDNRSIDPMSSDKQVQYIFAQFRNLLKQKFNI